MPLDHSPEASPSPTSSSLSADPSARPSAGSRAGSISETRTSGGGAGGSSADEATLHDGEGNEEALRVHDGVGPLTVKKAADLEKGVPGEDPPEPEPKVLAEDGTEVFVVDWKGKDDPACPLNWTHRRRMAATLVVAAFTFLSPLSSTMIAPASGQIATKFGITNEVIIAMTVSIFVLAYSVGPLFLGPLSELYGRTHVLQLANLVYLIFNLACGFATNTGQLLAFRFIAGLGGSAPLGIGAGVLGDLWRAEERGTAAAYYSLGPLLGPAVGPIIGGWIAQKVPNDGYRWIFFSSTIFCALVQVIGVFYLQETYHPILLQRQAAAIKKERGLDKHSDHVKTVYEVKNGRKTVAHVVGHGLVRPFVMLWSESILQILSLYMAFIYGLIYIQTTTSTDVFQGVYGESVGIAGTNFVAQGLGFFVCSQVNGRLLDYYYKKLSARNGGVGRPEFRLVLMIPASIFLPIGLFLYGWGTKTHWFVVDLGMFFIAVGMIGNFQCIQNYIIDCFTLHAASAMSGAAAARSLCGFAFPLWAPYMFNALGYGVGCTILAVCAIVIGCPAAPVLYKFGPAIRARSRHARK